MFRLAALLTLLVYGRTLSHALLWWDDQKNICANPHFRRGALDALKALWSQAYFGMYVPVTYTAWLGLARGAAALTGGPCDEWAPYFHAFNVGLHLLNGWLVYRLLQRLKPETDVAVLGAAAGFFLLHPLQVEAVAWVSATRDLLAVSFGLAALLSCSGRRPWLALPLFALSVLAKPVGVVFPVLALLLPRRRYAVLGPALLIAAAGAWVTKTLQADALLTFTVTPLERLGIAGQALGSYLTQLVYPVGLSPDYGLAAARVAADPAGWWIALGLLVPLALAWRGKESRRPLLWVLLALLPVLGFVSFGFQEISTVADRFFYLPMVGVAWLLAELIRHFDRGRRTMAALLLLGCAAGAFAQVGYWRDDEALFRRVLSLRDSPLAHGNLANVYFQSGKLAEAEPEYRRALAANPRLYDAWLGLGRTLELTGRADDAIAAYREAIAKNLALPAVYNNLATLLFQRRDPQCEPLWKEAAARDALYMEPRYNLGMLYAQTGRPAEAREWFTRALAIAPQDGRILERLRELEGK